MITQKQQNAMNLYTALISEARHRIDAVNVILSGQTKLSEIVIRELCYLQLRMLCETIALGCLVAHGDLEQPKIKSFEKEYAADKILRMMQTLDQDFFPQQAIFPPGHITANTNPNALKKEELLKLYAKCGEALHRGQVKKIMNSHPAQHRRLDVQDIISWTQKVEDLLGSHIMPLAVSDTVSSLLTCVLRDQASNLQTTVKRIGLSRQPDPQ
jgi:hypothetical protein